MHIMENNRFKVIIVEDVKLELKGTEEIFRHEIPNAEVIGTAMTENEFWELLKVQLPDMVLLDLGLPCRHPRIYIYRNSRQNNLSEDTDRSAEPYPPRTFG